MIMIRSHVHYTLSRKWTSLILGLFFGAILLALTATPTAPTAPVPTWTPFVGLLIMQGAFLLTAAISCWVSHFPVRAWFIAPFSFRVWWRTPRSYFTMGLGVGCVYLVGWLTEHSLLSQGIDVPRQEVVILLQDCSSAPLLMVAFVMICVLAPIVEELLFRGVVARVWGKEISIVLFVLVHGLWQIVPPLMVLAIALTWVFRRSQTLWAPIILHALFNAISFALILAGVA